MQKHRKFMLFFCLLAAASVFFIPCLAEGTEEIAEAAEETVQEIPQETVEETAEITEEAADDTEETRNE